MESLFPDVTQAQLAELHAGSSMWKELLPRLDACSFLWLCEDDDTATKSEEFLRMMPRSIPLNAYVI